MAILERDTGTSHFKEPLILRDFDLTATFSEATFVQDNAVEVMRCKFTADGPHVEIHRTDIFAENTRHESGILFHPLKGEMVNTARFGAGTGGTYRTVVSVATTPRMRQPFLAEFNKGGTINSLDPIGGDTIHYRKVKRGRSYRMEEADIIPSIIPEDMWRMHGGEIIRVSPHESGVELDVFKQAPTTYDLSDRNHPGRVTHPYRIRTTFPTLSEFGPSPNDAFQEYFSQCEGYIRSLDDPAVFASNLRNLITDLGYSVYAEPLTPEEMNNVYAGISTQL